MVEKFLDWIKSLPPKILEWWNKFSSKQKTAIVSIAIGVIVAFSILITVLTRTQYVNLVTCENTTKAAEVQAVLDSGEGIDYKVSDNGLVFSVNKKQLSTANLLLGTNNILSDTFKIQDVVSGGLTTTEADKQKLYTAYKEDALETMLEDLSFVDNATVNLDIPEDDGTLIAKKTEASANVMLTLNSECTSENANAMARAIKTAIGNESTEHIVIIDNQGNLLFSGDDELSMSGLANNQLTLKQQAEAIVRNEVRKVLQGTNAFDLVEVASNLTLDFSYTEKTQTTYTPADGQTQGLLSHESSYEAETEGGTALVPGTDSNGNDTYVYENGGNSSSTVSQYDKDYLPNTETIVQTIPAGAIIYDESSIAVTAIRYRVTKEEDAKKQGLLDGIDWDTYKAQNAEKVKLSVDEEFYSIVSDASGISVDDITIMAYEEPFFVDKEGIKADYKDVIYIVIAVLIVLLLGYVVIRSLKTDKAKEEEPEELSVEGLLQSMPTRPLEDISLDEKSDVRKLIEKFVDENPEAVANLLRNWLNEDWG